MQINSEQKIKTAWIGGGNGFIGHHMARRLKKEGYYVRVVDIKPYEYGENDYADEVVIADLRDYDRVQSTLRYQGKYSFHIKPWDAIQQFDEVYNFACQMGGAAYVFSGENDANIMGDSALINLNITRALTEASNGEFKGKIFYSSSACVYPQELQESTYNQGLKESFAWPANPDSCYGVEKLFSERLFLAYARNYGLNVRIARFHNIYGPEGTYKGGREKAPAAMCRKVIETVNSRVSYEGYNTELIKPIEVWGTGTQTRSFLYIDDCIDAVRLLMESDCKEPINIGSEESISINGLAKLAIEFSGNDIAIKNVNSNAIGVNGRNSDNTLARQVLGGWEPKYSLREGLKLTFNWIAQQYEK